MDDIEKTKLEEMEDFMDDVSEYKTFTIKYRATEQNKKVHKAFLAYSWEECDGGYLQAIKRLLELGTTDWKFATIYSDMMELKDEVAQLKEQPEEKKEKVKKTF